MYDLDSWSYLTSEIGARCSDKEEEEVQDAIENSWFAADATPQWAGEFVSTRMMDEYVR